MICWSARGRGVLSAAAKPFESTNWCAALAVVLDGCNGHPERLAGRGLARFEAAVVGELARWGGSRRRRAIIEAVFVALVDPTGVMTQRRGALERAGWVLADWRATTTRLAQVETCMVEVLDELGLTTYVTSIPGVSAVGAAAMLAETGDPARFEGPRALVKHAGLCPPRQQQRHVHWPVPHFPTGPASAAAGRLARGVGGTGAQPGDGRPLPVFDQPRAQPALRRAGQSSDRGCAAALDPRRRHPARALGSRYRRRQRNARSRLTNTTQIVTVGPSSTRP